MKSAKLHYWILGWFSMALCCWCASDTFTQSGTHSHPWKKLYFAHHWPVTVCKMNANDCHDPPKYWTIHGLWPDRAEDCNRTWHFNVTEIKDLLPDMKLYWPDVLHSSLNRTQFWKHEWDKHGTCAATLEVLNSQKKYFGKALELYQHVDLNGCLLKAGIKPSSSYYKMTAIREALTRFYGITPKIQCLPPEEKKNLLDLNVWGGFPVIFLPQERPPCLPVLLMFLSCYEELVESLFLVTCTFNIHGVQAELLPEGEKAQTIGQIEVCFTKELQLVNCSAQEGESTPVQAPLKLGTSELSVCNETLPTYYPSEVQDHQ